MIEKYILLMKMILLFLFDKNNLMNLICRYIVKQDDLSIQFYLSVFADRVLNKTGVNELFSMIVP